MEQHAPHQHHLKARVICGVERLSRQIANREMNHGSAGPSPVWYVDEYGGEAEAFFLEWFMEAEWFRYLSELGKKYPFKL